MNTRFLETLVWLSRLRSFSRVAEKLHTSQPAISNRINKLEELLGVRLYDRSARQFELTPAGRRILHHAEQMVTLSSELCELAVSDEQIDAQIRIGVLEMTTMSWLPSFIEHVMEAFPKAAFKIGTGTSPELLQKLRDDEMDLVFVTDPVNEPNVKSQPLCNIAISFVADPRRFPCDEEVDAVALSRLPIILPGRGSSGHAFLMDYFHRFGVTSMGSAGQRLVLEAIYSLGTTIQLARCGLGIVSLPTFLVAEDLQEGRLAAMKLRNPMPALNMTACCKQPVTNTLIVRLIDMASAEVADYAAANCPEHMWI